eukprot:364466-Chlamydomonas_euryale.AAC.15
MGQLFGILATPLLKPHLLVWGERAPQKTAASAMQVSVAELGVGAGTAAEHLFLRGLRAITRQPIADLGSKFPPWSARHHTATNCRPLSCSKLQLLGTCLWRSVGHRQPPRLSWQRPNCMLLLLLPLLVQVAQTKAVQASACAAAAAVAAVDADGDAVVVHHHVPLLILVKYLEALGTLLHVWRQAPAVGSNGT